MPIVVVAAGGLVGGKVGAPVEETVVGRFVAVGVRVVVLDVAAGAVLVVRGVIRVLGVVVLMSGATPEVATAAGGGGRTQR
jgi:hypothetical protein